ncbi:MAG: hypothetical protein RSC35_02525 [Mucinivorans sp.]
MQNKKHNIMGTNFGGGQNLISAEISPLMFSVLSNNKPSFLLNFYRKRQETIMSIVLAMSDCDCGGGVEKLKSSKILDATQNIVSCYAFMASMPFVGKLFFYAKSEEKDCFVEKMMEKAVFMALGGRKVTLNYF